MNKSKVDIHPAWFFTCDECGRDSIVYEVDITNTEEGQIDLQQFDDDERLEMRSLKLPDTAYCAWCKQSYEINFEDDVDSEF